MIKMIIEWLKRKTARPEPKEEWSKQLYQSNASNYYDAKADKNTYNLKR